MQRRDLGRLSDLIDELIEYQLNNGGSEFIVMSLCDLAAEAKALGNYSLQLELTERSIGIQPDDGWAWRQYADALLNPSIGLNSEVRNKGLTGANSQY